MLIARGAGAGAARPGSAVRAGGAGMTNTLERGDDLNLRNDCVRIAGIHIFGPDAIPAQLQ
jgi:hypothetical protein